MWKMNGKLGAHGILGDRNHKSHYACEKWMVKLGADGILGDRIHKSHYACEKWMVNLGHMVFLEIEFINLTMHVKNKRL